MTQNADTRPLGLYAYRAYVANEAHARALFEHVRWPRGPTCPRCGSDRIWRIGEDFCCAPARHHFSVTSGTVFSGTRLRCSQWLIAVALFKLGVNALGLQWAVGCHYRTANRALHLLREAVAADPFLASLCGEVEVDETYYGGKRKGKRGRGSAGKTIVLGFKERGGRVKTVVIPDVTRATLHDAVKKHVRPGAIVYSDGLTSYEGLDAEGYAHAPHEHSIHFIKTDVVHTQGIEGHWGHTKPIAKARYRRITRSSLPGICAENDFRTNERKNPDFIGLTLQRLLRSYPSNA